MRGCYHDALEFNKARIPAVKPPEFLLALAGLALCLASLVSSGRFAAEKRCAFLHPPVPLVA